MVLLVKILLGRCSCEFSKERQRYWLQGFRLHGFRLCNFQGSLAQLKALGELTSSAVLGTHSTRYYEIKPYRDPPHRFFRLTPESAYA